MDSVSEKDLSVDEGQIDNVTPKNMANLQAIARDYVARKSSLLDELCADLQGGRGSDMPGIGRE